MRRVVVVLRGALSLALAVVAAWCVYRGMRHLFGFEGPPGARQPGSMSGIGPALGWFAAGVLSLVGAAEAYPKPGPPAPDAVEPPRA